MRSFVMVLVCFLASLSIARANGTVTGTVVDAATSSPIAGAMVTFLDQNNSWIAEDTSDASGGFTQSLPPDIYSAYVSVDGYVRQLYDHIPCVAYCALTHGTPFGVFEGSTTTIGFSLDPAGTISGIVTATGGQPLQDIPIQIYLENYALAYAQTDSQGRYSIGQLQPDSGYRVATSLYQGPYLNEMYNDIPCGQSCDPSAGTPIAVTAGATTEVDFALTAGGTISGSVSGSGGVSLAGVLVMIFDSAGSYVTGTYTDVLGLFTTRGLPAGTYFAQTKNSLGYMDEVYINRLCPNDCEGACDPTSGTPIAVVLGADTPGIHFELGTGGGISGKITDSMTAAPVQQSYVDVYDVSGLVAGYTTTDASGKYLVQGLLPGIYYVEVSKDTAYFEQVYDGFSCAPRYCAPTTGTPVPVVADTITTSVNVSLVLGGSIQATFTDSQTGSAVLANANLYDSNKNLLHVSVTTVDNTYSVQQLQAGTYYLVARSYDHLDRVYGGSSCVADSCDLSNATPIVVTAGGTSMVAFSLDRGGTIAGTITDAGTGLPLKTVSVLIFDAAGRRASVSNYNFSGSYRTRALLAGSYYVVTSSRGDHVDQVYSGIPCLYGRCDPMIGIPVQVALENTTTVNFTLSRGQSISGRITDADTSLGVFFFGSISVFDSSGRQASVAAFPGLDPFGTYHAGGLIPGTYYVVLGGSGGGFGNYVGELYDGILCARGSCNPLSGTPVTVVDGVDTTGIDFVIHHGGFISGKVTDVRTGSGIEGVTVLILDANWNILSIGNTDCSGAYAIYNNLPTGVYYAMTLSERDYIEQRYEDASCTYLLACEASIGKPIAATLGEETTGVDFALRPANTVTFIDDFEDGALASNWAYPQGNWTESGGALNGQSGATATAVAAPAFGGCSRCTVEGVLNANAISASLLGWYNRDKKNYVELRMNPGKDRWVLRQYVHGSVAARAKARSQVDPNTNYRARIQFDGTRFYVTVDGTLLFSLRARGAPSGTAGFQVRSGNASFGELLVY